MLPHSNNSRNKTIWRKTTIKYSNCFCCSSVITRRLVKWIFRCVAFDSMKIIIVYMNIIYLILRPLLFDCYSISCRPMISYYYDQAGIVFDLFKPRRLKYDCHFGGFVCNWGHQLCSNILKDVIKLWILCSFVWI